MKKNNIAFYGKRKPLLEINKAVFKETALQTCASHQKTMVSLTYVLVSDEELLNMNIEHLQHDYFTDIITFDMSESDNEIEGEIYISADRVQENGIKNEGPQKEMLRVLFHGLLHLIGYNDKSTKEQKLMRSMEDQCITLYLQNNTNL